MASLKNYGLGPRGVHDSKGQLHILAIGEEKELDLSDAEVRQLRQSQRKGDTLHVMPTGKDKAKKDGKEGERQDAALAILNRVPDLSYLELLAESKTVLDPNFMPPRPERGDIIRRLAEVANGEESEHPNRFVPEETPAPEADTDTSVHPLRERQIKALEEDGRDPVTAEVIDAEE